jgi:hypothetical protein
MRAERMEGIASQRRDRTVEENMRIFEEMAKASEEVVFLFTSDLWTSANLFKISGP